MQIPSWILALFGLLFVGITAYGVYYFVTRDTANPKPSTSAPAPIVGGGGAGGETDTDAPQPPSVDPNATHIDIEPGTILAKRVAVETPNRQYVLKFDTNATDVVFVSTQDDRQIWKTYRLQSACVGDRFFELSEEGVLTLTCSGTVIWQTSSLPDSVKPYRLRLTNEGKISLIDGNDNVQWDPLQESRIYPENITVTRANPITSPNGRYVFRISSNTRDAEFTDLGNGKIYWTTNLKTDLKCNSERRLVFQSDGNVVLYCGDKATWASDTHKIGNAPYRLIMNNEPKASFLDKDNHSIWSTDRDIYIPQGGQEYYFRIHVKGEDKYLANNVVPFNVMPSLLGVVAFKNAKKFVFERLDYWKWAIKLAGTDQYISFHPKVNGDFTFALRVASDPSHIIHFDTPRNLGGGKIWIKISQASMNIFEGKDSITSMFMYVKYPFIEMMAGVTGYTNPDYAHEWVLVPA